jgi:hypothetical protein
MIPSTSFRHESLEVSKYEHDMTSRSVVFEHPPLYMILYPSILQLFPEYRAGFVELVYSVYAYTLESEP